MAFIKEESEDLKIEDTFTVKHAEQITVDHEEVRSEDGAAETCSDLSSESEEEEEEDPCQRSRQPVKRAADLESDSPPPKLQKHTQTVKAEVLRPPAHDDPPPASALLSPAPGCDSPAASPLLSAGMDMGSSNTQVGCGVDDQLVLMDPKKISPTPLHHHHQPEPLIQGRMIHAFMLLSRASECVSRNGDSSEQQRFSNLLLSSFGVEQYIVSSLEEIKLRLTVLERAVASISRAKEVMLPGGVLLPLQDYQDLQSLELRMEDAQCQKDLTAYLGTIGGCNIQIATRRILTTLIGHNLATKLTWTGSSQKKPFQNLRLKRVVTESVRMCGFQPSLLDSDIENEIKVWLRNSRDRAGGRKQRYLRMLTS
ncbi:uncharacterized protein si:dkey-172k15.5 isoform X2 [Danio rerio]|uniref:Uncharacterized protein si:dkey-172k15.5 isoform X2 n=1 Tax=Danio rerio TaxID=7955 RepID=A0AC58JEC2_DANRE